MKKDGKAEAAPAPPSSFKLAVMFATVLTLGLTLNVSLELITRIDGASGNLISIAQCKRTRGLHTRDF